MRWVGYCGIFKQLLTLPIHTASTHELTLNSHHFPSWFEQDTNGMLLALNGSSAIQAALRSQQAAELLRELSKKTAELSRTAPLIHFLEVVLSSVHVFFPHSLTWKQPG